MVEQAKLESTMADQAKLETTMAEQEPNTVEQRELEEKAQRG